MVVEAGPQHGVATALAATKRARDDHVAATEIVFSPGSDELLRAGGPDRRPYLSQLCREPG